MDAPIQNEWLAELLTRHYDQVTDYWIEDIRAENIIGYKAITDEQLRQELPATVDSMMHALRTGDEKGPLQHAYGVIRRRLGQGFQLPDIQMSLHALETAVMRIVRAANVGAAKEFEALQSASMMYYRVALIAATVYEQLRTEQQERFARAYEFGITLSKNLDLDAILDIAVNEVAGYVRTGSVAILLARPKRSTGEVGAYCNLDSETVDILPALCGSIGCGEVDTNALKTRQTTCIVPDVRVDERLTRWADVLVSQGYLSVLCAPLLAKGKRLGDLVVLWPDVHAGSDFEMDFLLAIAGHIANAMQNAVLYAEAQGKRELGVLLKASRRFASSLDTQDILRKIARMATEAIRADLAIAYLVDRQREGSHHVGHYAGSRRARDAARRVMEVVAPEGDLSWFDSLGRDLAGRKPVLFGNPAEFPQSLESLDGTIGSVLAVPLMQKDVMVGAFTLMSLGQNAFTENDLLLAAGLGDLANVAIENAQSYGYERNISETLQRSFLPSRLPSIEGYETAAYYRPAIAEAGIGGDFYDLFANGQGDISIIIGDVSGKGLKAAVPTAMGKYMVRAYAAENPSPSSVLTRFNRTFYENAPDGQFMTALYGTLDLRDNVFTYVSAGHNPPLLYSAASGQVAEVDIGGICLGIFADAEYVDKSIQLQPGDVLLLFTDGATDVKENSNRLEVEGLQRLFLSNVSLPAEQIVQNVFDGIFHYGRGRLADDVALVVVKRVAQ